MLKYHDKKYKIEYSRKFGVRFRCGRIFMTNRFPPHVRPFVCPSLLQSESARPQNRLRYCFCFFRGFPADFKRKCCQGCQTISFSVMILRTNCEIIVWTSSNAPKSIAIQSKLAIPSNWKICKFSAENLREIREKKKQSRFEVRSYG